MKQIALTRGQEAIALLEKDAEFYDNVGSGRIVQIPRDDYDQALTILQQPKAQSTEFTKKIRTEPYNPKWEHTLIIRTEDRDELCDRLDESEASRKELLENLKMLVALLCHPGSFVSAKDIEKAEAAIAKAE